MITTIPISLHQSIDRTGSTHRFENQKQQSMNLLQRVKQHLQYKSQTFRTFRQCVIDSQQLDKHVDDELNDKKYITHMDNDDINHQKLIDDCVRDILNYNKPVPNETDISPILRSGQRLSFSQIAKSIPKNRVKRLSSTILVGQMVKNKGLEKPTINQIKLQQIDKIIRQERDRNRTEINQKSLKIVLPIILTKNQERKSMNQLQKKNSMVTASQRLLKTKKRVFSQDPSPLLENHTSFSIISDSFDCSPKQYESNRRLGTLIQQLNNEKDEITTHQRKIRNSIVLNQQNFNKIDERLQPENQEKYNYLKHEQQIFGKKKSQQTQVFNIDSFK
ncbi:unnamed protein product [Paramecium pentaurelia]|uniref:Uncharacterized protein n=1 Tax=Paramecium pentaurelia TaxID=43138 RepID=A0A8S1VGK7_9CILI|nr:unnamed protein product [Paramecium pentaurelia]